jgi:tetratricopeptide (TPR) repeat protein
MRYVLDDDGEVPVVHRDGARFLQLLSPSRRRPAPHWPAGMVSFEGTIEGRHGERQQFVLLATKSRVLPDPFPFERQVSLARLYHEARTRAELLPPDQWCEAIWPYTAVDMRVVESYRHLTDLAALEAACLGEIHNKEDWAKSACGEVCHRVLASYATVQAPTDPALHALFIAITERLIRYWAGYWRKTWDEAVLQDVVQAVYSELFITARRRPLAFTSTVKMQDGTLLWLPCYTALLAYLKTITWREVLPIEWRQERRAELHTLKPQAPGERGATYLKMGHYEEALRDFTQALTLAPDDIQTLAQRGVTYHQLGHYEKAVADFTHTLELAPADVWTLRQRGRSYLDMDQYEEALADFTRALDLAPDDAWTLGQRGNTYRWMGRYYEEALADFTHALDLAPDLAWVWSARGETYRRLGRYREALADFTHALDLVPNDAWALDHRGAAYRHLGRYREAVADFTHALELAPNNGWFLHDRALAYQALGQANNAIRRAQRTYSGEMLGILATMQELHGVAPAGAGGPQGERLVRGQCSFCDATSVLLLWEGGG